MAELMNCPRCGNVFVQTIRDICEACYKEEEAMFEKVYAFIRKKENRQATLTEVCDATGVPERVVIRFIKQGRLRTAQFPHLSYPCESCGSPINEGNLCDTCRRRIQTDLENVEKEEARKRLRQKAYYIMDEDRS